MKNSLLIISFFFLLGANIPLVAQSLQWTASYGGPSNEFESSIAVDTAGNVYTAGGFSGTVDFNPGSEINNLTASGTYDIFIQKLDAFGNYLWAHRLGSTSNDQGFHIVLDSSANIYVAGLFQGTVDFDPGPGTQNLTFGPPGYFILKLDADGNFIWVGAIGAPIEDIAVDPAENVFLVGELQNTQDFDPGIGVFNLSSAGSADIFIEKLDASGNMEWVHTMGSADDDRGNGIAADLSGNVYATGYFRNTIDFDPGAGTTNLSATGIRDLFVQKLDGDGNLVWARSMGGSATNADVQGADLTVDPAQNVYLTGSFFNVVDFDPGPGTANLFPSSNDIFVEKLDANGDYEWAVNMGRFQSDAGNAIALDTLGNIYTTGFFENTADFDPGAGVFNLTSNGFQDIYVHKLDNNGNFVWAVSMGANGGDQGVSIAVDQSTAVHTSGYYDGTVDFDPDAMGTLNFTSNGGRDIFQQKLLQCEIKTGTDVVTACGSHTWLNGITYTESNNTASFTILGGASSGCDSLVFLDLTILPIATHTDVVSACESYTWIDGVTYTASNNTATQLFMGGAANGCDSLVTLDLTILDPATHTDVVTACGSYRWIDGLTYTASNNTATHLFSGGAANGCDSLVTLDLTILPIATFTDVISACDSHTWVDGVTYESSNNSAVHTILGGASNGCDSLVFLDLTILPSATNTQVVTVCESFTWIDGITYTESNNTASHIFPGGAANGCDSLVNLDLTVLPIVTHSDVVTACDSYTWIDGVTYTSDNDIATHLFVGGASNGCDSLVTLDLTILPSATYTDIVSSCGSYTWIDGVTYTVSNNTATHTIAGGAANGCDSLVMLDLTILPIATGTDVVEACDSFDWIDGNTYTEDNSIAQHTIVGGAANGCDSLVTLNLTITTIDPEVSVDGNSLIANTDGASYQWIDCDNGNTPISGETGQVFMATTNGSYAVEITQNGCTAISECTSISILGLESSFDDVAIFPNPNRGVVNINVGVLREANIRVFDLGGKIVYEKLHLNTTVHQFDLGSRPAIYIVELSSGSQKERYRLIVQ